MRIHWTILLACELIAVITGSFFFRKITPRLLYIYLYVVVGATTEILLRVVIKILQTSTNSISHFYFPIEFLLLALFYVPLVAPLIKRQWMIGFITLFMVYSVVNMFLIQGLQERSDLRAYTSIILVVFSLTYFYRIMIESKLRKLAAEPMVWINSAILLFFASIFFYNLLFPIALRSSLELAKLMSTLNRLSIAIFYLVIAYSFYLEGRKTVTEKRVSLE